MMPSAVLQASWFWKMCCSSLTVLHTLRQWPPSSSTSPTPRKATCRCLELTPAHPNSYCLPFIGRIGTFAPPWRLRSNSVGRVSELRSTSPLQTTLGDFLPTFFFDLTFPNVLLFSLWWHNGSPIEQKRNIRLVHAQIQCPIAGDSDVRCSSIGLIFGVKRMLIVEWT